MGGCGSLGSRHRGVYRFRDADGQERAEPGRSLHRPPRGSFGDTSDIPALDEAFFGEARLRLPKGKQLISLRIDRDVLDWFERQGKGYQSKINAVLRAYVRAQRR